MRKLIRIRNARIYLLGDVVSTLGDSALWLAMAIWTKELTGSSASAGLVVFCFAIGNLFSPFGGAIADRFRRRALLVWLNLIAAGLVLLIVLVHGRGQIWIIYLVIFCYGMIGSTMDAAQTGLLPDLVPQELLAEANAAKQALNEGLRLITPLIGAGVFALTSGAVVAEIDAGTFLVAMISLIALRIGREPSRGPADRSGMRAGFRFIGGEPTLRSLTIALSLAMLALGFTESACFSVVTVGLHRTAAFIGVLMMVQGGSAVVAGLMAAGILRRVGEGVTTALGVSGACAGVLLLTLPSLTAALAGMVCAGVVGPWTSVAAVTAIQRRTPSNLLGRVSGAFGLSMSVPQVTSVGLGAMLIAEVGYRVLLVIVAVVAGTAVFYLMSRPENRGQVSARVLFPSAATRELLTEARKQSAADLEPVAAGRQPAGLDRESASLAHRPHVRACEPREPAVGREPLARNHVPPAIGREQLAARRIRHKRHASRRKPLTGPARRS